MTGLTIKEYIDCLGNTCPFCGSSNIESMTAIDIEDGEQDVHCNDCLADWTDLLKIMIVGIEYNNVEYLAEDVIPPHP